MKTQLASDDVHVGSPSVAVHCDRNEVAAALATLRPHARIVVAWDELRHAFDGPPAAADDAPLKLRKRIVNTFYGAPPALHDGLLKELAKPR